MIRCGVLIFLFLLTVGTLGAIRIFHAQTDWRIVSSFKYDALCALNILSNDPFYTQYYKKDTRRFDKMLTPEAREAAATIKRVIKDENHGIVSAALTWYFSALPDSTLDQLLATTSTPESMHNAFAPSVTDPNDLALLVSLSSPLHTVFQWMRDSGFEADWQARVRPIVEKKINRVEKKLDRYNVVAHDEDVLGSPLASNRVTVYVLYYCVPHGIRIQGVNFLTDQSYAFDTVIRNAAHELIHPPCDLKTDQELLTALATLKNDSFFMDKVEHHDPSFGYNDFMGLVEEDCVQALEQLSCQNMKIAENPQQRWKISDDGMHVFAVALYATMIKRGYNADHEKFRDFLLREVTTGDLQPSHIQVVYDTFYK